jgi:hypothetical protein
MEKPLPEVASPAAAVDVRQQSVAVAPAVAAAMASPERGAAAVRQTAAPPLADWA